MWHRSAALVLLLFGAGYFIVQRFAPPVVVEPAALPLWYVYLGKAVFLSWILISALSKARAIFGQERTRITIAAIISAGLFFVFILFSPQRGVYIFEWYHKLFSAVFLGWWTFDVYDFWKQLREEMEEIVLDVATPEKPED